MLLSLVQGTWYGQPNRIGLYCICYHTDTQSEALVEINTMYKVNAASLFHDLTVGIGERGMPSHLQSHSETCHAVYLKKR